MHGVKTWERGKSVVRPTCTSGCRSGTASLATVRITVAVAIIVGTVAKPCNQLYPCNQVYPRYQG